MRIVMVDDENSSIHTFIDKILDDSDIEPRFFKDNEKEILNYVAAKKINAAILDIKMPNIVGGGFALAKKLIEINPKIKIVFLTGLNIKKEDIPEDIANNVLGIMYKPINDDELRYFLKELSNQSSVLKAEMFGTFDCFINGSVVRFSSKKSKELFALLLTLNGKSLTMEHAITCLWPDKNTEQSKVLYRDAVWRLRQTLSSIKFECVEFQRGLLILDKSNIESDYYDYLDGKIEKNTLDDFLVEYDWSIDIISTIL